MTFGMTLKGKSDHAQPLYEGIRAAPTSGTIRLKCFSRQRALELPTSSRVATAWRLSDESVTWAGAERESQLGSGPYKTTSRPLSTRDIAYLIRRVSTGEKGSASWPPHLIEINQPQSAHPRAEEKVRCVAAYPLRKPWRRSEE